MSEDRSSGSDPLEVAIHAFQQLTVPERPPDAEVLVRLGPRLRDSSRSISHSIPSTWRKRLRFFAPAAAAATVLLILGGALILRNNAPPTPDQAAATDLPDATGDVAGPIGLASQATAETNSRRLKHKSLEQSVAESQVIVVATALEPDPALPVVPGNPPENRIRFQVNRVLKGQFAVQVIVTQTPTAAVEFVGKQWIVMLSPGYIAGKHSYAGCHTIAIEADVKAILTKNNK